MIHTILVPLDGSRTAEAILPQVRRLTGRQDAEVVLLRAVEPFVDVTGSIPSQSERELVAAEYLSKMEKKLSADGMRVRSIASVGVPAELILEKALSERASVIAMSTHGEGALQRWVFGSVTEKVLRASVHPVLVMRAQLAHEKTEEVPFRNFLVPVDGSELSHRVLPWVSELSRLFDAKLSLLYVKDSDEDDEKTALKEAQGVLEAEGVPFTSIFRKGEPAFEILDACEPNFIGLIAMSTHGRTGAARWVFGSVTEKVLQKANVPLFIVPGSDRGALLNES